MVAQAIFSNKTFNKKKRHVLGITCRCNVEHVEYLHIYRCNVEHVEYLLVDDDIECDSVWSWAEWCWCVQVFF